MKPPSQMNFQEFSALMDDFKSKDDCIAAPICHAIGNLRTNCAAGGIS